ncbi:SusC/RagA family TonB-linked outer membrane protein [Mucilaginibacter sp. SP1R1]|uniref:SusC/RagA family TonB-linked outer membrane protein n=1 Tax=Mucilaginibacter sp. SP1R1 TaxID=2723091 RepID=UPI001611D561|nr:TonB-dependent receptor [Mucilaginibacter sp. SP1R1]MBB6148386.1 TonB-linked SusC/RagA family outer membrane protein [Mucilaginibacter sp. SP1R1]
MKQKVPNKLGLVMLCCILLLSFQQVFSQQQKNISGHVKDEEGLPMPSVSIHLVGTTQGTTTDVNGFYKINAPENATLEFSFMGYEKKAVKVTGSWDGNVAMQPDKKTRDLNEVVVVAYGTQKKANLTGSVSAIGTKELQDRPVTNLNDALQGTMAGVTVTTTGGQPGSSGNINIRGIGTLNNSTPMVVVDGIIGSLSDVNPNDVQSISVLKDAASAAIYGSRAANGVILVTTKRGKSGKMQINYTGYVGKQKPTNLPDFLPSWQAATLYNQALANEGQAPYWTANDITLFKNQSDPDTHPNTDWQSFLYKGSGFQQNHAVNISGGDEKTQYAFSLGYFQQDGIIQKSNYQRYTTRMNLNSAITKNFSVNANLSFLYAPTQAPDGLGGGDIGGIIGTTAAMNSTVVNQYKNGVYNYLSFGNPISWLNSPGYNNNQNSLFTGNVGADWELIKGLHFKPSFAYRYNANPAQEFKPADIYYDPKTPTVVQTTVSQSSIANANTINNYYNLQGLLEYDRHFGKHSIDILAGTSQELTSYQYLYAYRQNFLNSSLSQINAAPSLGQQNGGTSSQLALLSYFGRARYSYDDRYLFEANLRDDGSSRFANGQRWGVYPSFSAGWNISKEAFFGSLSNTIPLLKLRASWGKLGNQTLVSPNAGNQTLFSSSNLNIASPYPAISVVNSGQNYSFNQTLAPGIALNNGANPFITWEKTTTTDVGMDMELLNSSLSFTADYFVKNTDGILLQLPASSVYGFSTPYQNAGAVRNAGWELGAAYRNKIGSVSYNIAVNASFIKNKITDLAGTGSISSGLVVGEPIRAFYGYEAEGIFQTQQQVTDHAKQSGGVIGPGDLMYKDISGPNGKPDGVIDGNDRVYLGSPFPKTTFGFTLGAGWNGFNVSGFFQGALGVKNYVQGFELGSLQQANIGNPTSALLDAWTPTNTSATFPRLWSTYTQNNPQNFVSSFWVRNASYLRMKNLLVSYSLPAKTLEKLGVKGVKIYYSGQNIFTLTSFYKWVDPETSAGNNAYGSYPQLKTNTLGLEVTF